MMGGVSGSRSSDTANASIEVNLTDVWKKYVIDLRGKNLSNIITGFRWVVSKSNNPDGCTIYLDEIRYENVSVELGVSNNTKKGEWLTETYNSIKNHPDIKMVCYFNVDKGGTKYLTGESDWAVFTTPRDNRNNIDDCTFDPNKRIAQYNESVKDDHYIYRFPLYETSLKGDLNSDDRITPADAAIALQLAATGAHNSAADVSGDGAVTSFDALMILQAAAGVISL